MSEVGIPELLFILLALALWLAPLIAAAWALLMLHRLRTGQDDVRRRLEAIERLLQRGASPA